MHTLVPVQVPEGEMPGSPLFLGIWARCSVWKADQGETLSYPYDDYKLLEKDFSYSIDLYTRLLPFLQDVLERMGISSLKEKGVEIYYGVWLFNFIQVLLERYRVVKHAIDEGGWDHYIALDSHDYSIPESYMGYQLHLASDAYNLQIYSEIIRTLKPEIPVSTVRIAPYRRRRPSFSKKLRWFQRGIDFLSFRSTALLDSSYWSMRDALKLFIRSGFRIRPFFAFEDPLMPEENRDLREQLHQKISLFEASSNEAEFEYLLCKILAFHIPRSFLEGYGKVKTASDTYGFRETHFYAAVSLYSKETFRLSLARAKDEGATLVLGQHGGFYGIGKWSSMEYFERNIADRYVTFGWNEGENTVPISHPKLIIDLKSKKESGAILYVSNNFPRYFYKNWASPISGNSILEYFYERERFWQLLDEDMKERMLLRLYPEDYGWKHKERVDSLKIGYRIDDGSRSYLERLEETELVVVDNNHTTYLESLTAGKPTLFFWNSEHWKLRKSAVPYLNSLEKAGVFHKSGESAARFINKLNEEEDGIQKWWGSPDVQDAVNAFCQNYANRNENWLEAYVELLAK